MNQPVNIYVSNVKGVKLITLVYPNGQTPIISEIDDLKDCVLLETVWEGDQTKQIWVYQPHYGDFEIEFGEHEYFELLEEKVNGERQKFRYQGMFTASLFAKNGGVIAYNTQDLSKHILTSPTDEAWWAKVQQDFNISDELLVKIKAEIPEVLRTGGLDIREALKHFISIPSGVGYNLNPGSHEFNHAEARTLFDYLGVTTEDEYDEALLRSENQDKVHLLQGSTCYLYGHWWCCKDCSRKMQKAGVSQIIISKDWVEEHIDL